MPKKGTALYLSLIIISVLLIIVLGLSAILINQLRISQEAENSVIAFFAADTAIERVLSSQGDPGDVCNVCTEATPCQLDENTFYFCEFRPKGTDWCTDPNVDYYCIRAVGLYYGTRRAIEIVY